MIVWLVFVIAGLVSGVVVRERLAADIATSAGTARLGDSLGRLFSTLQDAETGQRGFLLTGEENYLEPVKNAEKELPNDFAVLAPLVAGDKTLQKDLLELRGLAGVRMAELNDSIRLRREQNLAEAAAFVSSSTGRETVARIHKAMADIRRRQSEIFLAAGNAAALHLKQARWLGWWVGLLGVGAGLAALCLVRISHLQERTARELLAGKLQAEKTAAEKGAFLANISHEIRTPMNAILGFGELLECEPLTPRQAQYVRSIRQSGKSLLQLISDVLDLSKLEAGKLELNREPANFREICNFLQTMFGQQAAGKSLQLIFEADAVPPALLLDRLRLRQILVNLLGNAVKFTSQGHIRTSAEWISNPDDRSLGTLLIHVEDTGMGISAEKQEEIFKPFVQSDPSPSSGNDGAGLGLHIVQRLTQIMGGTVTLDSTPGKGSTFHLRLPDISISARLPVNDMVETEGTVDFDDFAAATLLVVDDNETNRTLIARIFESTRHRVCLARDGREALEKIKEEQPTLVLLDIRMPAMDGHAVLAQIRRTAGLELLPVIAVTASSQSTNVGVQFKAFSGYIRKPFTRQALYEELAQFLPRIADRRTPAGNGSAGQIPQRMPARAGRKVGRLADRGSPNCGRCRPGNGRNCGKAWP